MHPVKKAARIAGAIYASMVVTGPFSLIYVPSKLIVRDNAAATAENVLAHETMFRLSILGDLVGLLVFRSGFLPRFIGVWLMINCFGYVILSVIALFFPAYYGAAFNWSQPVLFGELAIMLWLLIKGAKVPAATTTAAAVAA